MHLYIFILSGFVLSTIFQFTNIHNQQWYLLTVAVLLAAGLYSSTFSISIAEARTHVRLILKAITIGVFLKALIIGGILAFSLNNPFGFILGIIVAQIDPLSTAALMKGNRMSESAKSILAAWSSFDDPMTVILSLYAPVFVAMMIGIDWQPIRGSVHEFGVTGYIMETGINLLFAASIFILWQLMKRHSKATNYVVIALIALGMYGLLIGSLSIAVYYFWMLGIAILGLFMRPPIKIAISRVVRWALSIAAILLGILLVNGINIWTGIILGFSTYAAQIIVGFLLTGKLSMRDRLHIAFAQQNGITAIILSLLFESYYPGTVAIIAPAIIVVNTVHSVSNKILDIYLERNYFKLKPHYHMERLKAHIHKI
jgi:NhaP-type Na+/H+ or K+/H+ antiporter